MKLIIDSYAWVEYLDGSPAGEKVEKLLLGNNEIYTLSLMIAEVISRVKRVGGDFEIAYDAIVSNSKIIDITRGLSKDAGLFHAKIREKIKDFGLVDALVFIAAKEIGAKIVTGDEHFRNFKESIFIK